MEINEIKQSAIQLVKNLFADIDEDMIEYVDFIDDLGMDSITFISIVVEIEDRFDIIVPDDMLLIGNFRNVDDIVNCVVSDMQKSELQDTEDVEHG